MQTISTVTRVAICFRLDAGQTLDGALAGLPKHCQSTFVEHAPGAWSGEFVITCPVAPCLADGDFEDDFVPHFSALLRLKQFYDASFELHIAVGRPGPEDFLIPSHMVALLAALGAPIWARPSRIES